MNPSLIENAVHTVLTPEFRCKINSNPHRVDSLTTFMRFTPQKLKKTIKGGKDLCLVSIGETISVFNKTTTSVLITDQNDKIVCNQSFKIKRFKKFQEKQKVNFTPDFIF
ncbi:hypothetical protein [Aquimarina sp. I32.4]|uniref:hypothetical protein n=1 Tax=Aquimarina sp. I32.4 TaxID=2053903 RepID=UPI000CDEC84C|nr:hypothetical protein [Aquimarina sp. I32.4]